MSNKSEKTMGGEVSSITDTIYYGVVKYNIWVGKREDVTDIAIKAVFEWFMHKCKKEAHGREYQIKFKNVPYVLSMRKEETNE